MKNKRKLKLFILSSLLTGVLNSVAAEFEKFDPAVNNGQGLPLYEKVEKARANDTTFSPQQNETSATPYFSQNQMGVSEINRSQNNFSITASIFGLSFSEYSAGVEFGWIASPSFVISARAVALNPIISSNDEYDYDLDDWWNNTKSAEEREYDRALERNGEGQALHVDFKFFPGNSFYVKPGLYYRYQDFARSDFSGSESWAYTEGSFEDVGLSLAIGNQWQWSHFTLGCDWFGVTQSLIEISSTGRLPTYTRSINIAALNFYLGASF